MQTSLDIKVSERFGSIIKKFKILHYNWEMDEVGYVIWDGVQTKIITTDHNKLKETNTDYLKNKISEYQTIINETQEVINLVENGKNKI